VRRERPPPHPPVAPAGPGRPREDYVAPGEHESVAFAIDPSGRLAWESNDIDGDHVVAILSERVSDAYLALLRDRGVSYLLAGGRDVDLALALEKIGERFGVRTLMLEGGGRINGAMLRAGLIDEVSLLVAAVADGRVGTPALFDIDGDDVTPHRLALDSAERRADGSGSATASSAGAAHVRRRRTYASDMDTILGTNLGKRTQETHPVQMDLHAEA
jgi:2,5-diamino-6-(ribosylamino)-4(3H)-pyrimidinone 5'-phosphate reductase